jgi:hypothetical protein
MISFVAGGSTATVETPLFGYKSRIQPSFDVIRSSDDAWHVYDNGTDYDKYICDCTFLLNETQQETLNNFIKGAGRATAVKMVLPSGSGFYPFSPYRGDVGDFYVAIEYITHPRVRQSPRKYFESEVKIYKDDASWPSYSIPDSRDEGAFQIGTVSNLRCPIDMFSVAGRYAYTITQTEDRGMHYIDRSSNGDRFTSNFQLNGSVGNIAKVLQYLLSTNRSSGGELSNFQVVAPSNYYMFGRDNSGSATYNVRQITREIEVTHNNYNDFQFELSLAYVSTA